MTTAALKREVCEANRRLAADGLVILTWGNVSGIDRAAGLVAIKPSGVDYASLRPADIAVVDLDGRTVEGRLRPSVDTPTHIEIYRRFPSVGGITHVHSPFATAFAQACMPVPALGTTHADTFHGDVPVTRMLTRKEVRERYTEATGEAIAQALGPLAPDEMPAVLVARHGPFAWGADAMESVEHAAVLEAVARIALATLQLNPHIGRCPRHLLDKHFRRKHGPAAAYGQARPPRRRRDAPP